MQETITIEMSERDGNAFAILDYDHLLQTFIGHHKVNVI